MNKIFRTILTGALTSTCILFPFSACGEDDGLKTVKINEVTHSVFYAPLYLADALGYFEDFSIKIELTNGGGADNVMSAVLSGDADIGFCGPEAALYVLIGGSTDAAKVFGQLTKRDGSFLVAREAPDGDFDWNELVGKEVLAGRRGGVPAMTFEYVLKEHDILPQVNLNYDVAFNLMTSAFEAGTADYCTMFDPVAYDFESKGYHVVASVGEASGEIPYTCFMAKESWLEDNKTHAQNFLTAVTKAIKYVNETDENTVAEYLKPYFEGTEKAALAASVKRYKNIDAWVTNMAMTESSFTRLQDVIESAGELERRVEFSSLIDVTYANAAYRNVYST